MRGPVGLILFSVLLVCAEDEAPVDDVDRTDFSDPSLNADLDKVKLPTGPHSEIESAALLVDLVDDKVPVGVTSYLLASLANMGPKMFNVSSMSGTLSLDGQLVTKFPAKVYGDPLGPTEQRSVRYGFTPSEETAPGAYALEVKIFYNNREKDQFVDTVFSETVELVPKPPSMEARLRMLKAAGACALLVVLLLLGPRVLGLRSAGGKGKGAEKPSKADSKKAANPVGNDEWLSSTLAGSENQSPKKSKRK